MGSDIHNMLSVWDDAIRKVQALRQDEVRCRSRLPLEPPETRMQMEEQGMQGLSSSIHALSVASRHARTALWASLMVTSVVPSPSSSS